MADLILITRTTRRFQDEKNRLAVTNQLLTIELIVYYFIASSFSVYELMNKNFGVFPLVIIIISMGFAFFSWLMFFRDRSSKKFCYKALSLFYPVYFVVLVFENEQMTLFLSIVILTALVVYLMQALRLQEPVKWEKALQSWQMKSESLLIRPRSPQTVSIRSSMN